MPQPISNEESKKARDLAGNAIGVGGRYVDMARNVRQYKPELEQEVISGKKPLASVSQKIEQLASECID